MAFEIELSLGEDKAVYERLIASLPPGQDNLVHDLIIPTHTKDRPVSLIIKNVVPEVGHILQVTSEWGVPAMPTVGFVPKSTSYTLTVPLPYGPCILTISNSLGDVGKVLAAVTNYAVWFRAEAREITEHSLLPITTLEENIKSSVAYILAMPLIAKINRFIPTDLETLGVLANKLLVKNLLWRPGTDAGTRELLAAFGASNPVFFPMTNLGTPETPLYRTEEVFSGYEAHLWLPNREIERWRAFTQYLNNLPQLYSLKEVTEGFVYVQIGDRIHQHVFDFESDFANTVLEGQTGDNCFLRLFRLDMTFEAEVFISFCQASYSLDNTIPFPGLETTDTDLIPLTNFRDWSLTGRFEQQFDICFNQHAWVYDSPVIGVVDGINRFYSLSQDPASSRSVKLFLDGLLLRNLIDYRISTGTDYRSGIYQLPVSPSPILLTIAVGDPKPFLAPVFSSLEVFGGANLEYLITAGNQTLTDVSFIVSSPPASPGNPQEARLHYLTPALPSGSYAGVNQYGTEVLPFATTTFVLTFPTAAVNINYQLFIQYAEDPAGSPSTVSQPHYIIRNHNLATAIIEFTAPIDSLNAKLHWWLIEADNVALERGTIILNDGDNTALVPFTNGPYLDQVVLMIQLWNTTAVGSLPILLFSFKNFNPFSAVAQFSEAIAGTDYRLDYAIFPSQAGQLLEIFVPPSNQLVEAHFDTLWPNWAHTAAVEPVDGLINTFTLPYPCPHHEAMYAVLDGRVLVQGISNQYILESDTKLKFTFTPQAGQILWLVYPIADFLGVVPTSTWHQGYLTRQPDTSGSFAVGSVLNAGRILDGDLVKLKGVEFAAKQTSRGVVFNPLKITASDSLIFVGLGVTFTGVLHTSYITPTVIGTFTPAEVNIGTDEIYIADHGMLSGTNVYITSTGTVPAGLTVFARYFIKNATANTFQLALTEGGATIDITGTGLGVHTLSKGALPTEFKVGVSPDSDSQALVSIINAYPTTGSIYFAEYLGFGHIEVRAKYLGGGIYDQPLTVLGLSMTVSAVLSNLTSANIDSVLDTITITNHGLVSGTKIFMYSLGTMPGGINASQPYYVTNPTSNTFQLATVIAGPFIDITSVGSGTHTVSALTLPIFGDSVASRDEIQTLVFSSVPTSGNFYLGFENEVTAVLPFNATSTQIESALNSLPNLQNVFVVGNFSLGFAITFNAVDGATDQPLVYLAETSLVLLPSNINTVTNTLTFIGHGFHHAQAVGIFTTGIAPAGLTVGTPYYIILIDADNFQLTTVPGGTVIDITTTGSGLQKVSNNSLTQGGNQVTLVVNEQLSGYGNRYPANVSRLLDSNALAKVINDNHIVNKVVLAVAAEGVVNVTAKHIGSQENELIFITGTSMTTSHLKGGVDSRRRLPMLTYKPFYYRDAPVIAIDGVSTRLYNSYSGNSVQFDTPPVNLQEPYIVSQIYPMENHPLDSMAANQPCSYPKGNFTQGLTAQLTDIDVEVVEDAVLVITVNNLPLQEQPSGVVNGVNTIFDMTLESCAGQNSMMLWLDGVFQNPTKFTYSVSVGHGVITFLTPPAIGQKLWVWYLPQGDACTEEHVVQLTGTYDGVNQTFGVPNSPFVNKPALVAFLDGLYQAQDIDYSVPLGNTTISYLGALAPAAGQALWAHFNEGNIGAETWRQVTIAVSDGVTTVFTIPFLVTSDLPTSQDSVILALNGVVQREAVDFIVNLGLNSFPDGTITFIQAPEAGRKIQVAYIRKA